MERLFKEIEIEGNAPRFKIVKDQIIWNFTREQLKVKIFELNEQLIKYNKMLESIDSETVELEPQLEK